MNDEHPTPPPHGHGLAYTLIGIFLAGGVAYSVGSVVFVTGRPHLWPRHFGSHDLWHVLVLVGSACHFIVMWAFVASELTSAQRNTPHRCDLGSVPDEDSQAHVNRRRRKPT